MGTFTRKMGRHSDPNRSASISSPPSSGPAMMPSPIMAP